MNNERLERGLSLAGEILDLRGRLKSKEAEYSQLMGISVELIRERASIQPSPAEANRKAITLADRIVQILEEHRGQEFDGWGMLEILEINASRIGSVRSTFYRLLDANKIAKGATPGKFRALGRGQAGIVQPDGDNRSNEVHNAAP
jgi:hypothetical protein